MSPRLVDISLLVMGVILSSYIIWVGLTLAGL